MALEVEFELLAPDSLAQRFQAAGERVARMLQRRETGGPA